MSTPLSFLSVCSGYGGAELAWEPLGWLCKGVAEIDPAARAVLKHHWPHVKNYGDFTKIGVDDAGTVDVVVGGTPCQSFSIAGLRAGLGDDRGNLTIEFLRLVGRKRPRWVVWENVPGVYSATSHVTPDPCPPAIDLDGPDGPRDGEEVMVEDEYHADEDHAFSCFLAGLSELGYGFAYRTLDAQYFGIPQRRRRVFVVGCIGDGASATAVLFERHCLSGHPAPRREAGQIAPTIPARSLGGGGLGTDFDCDRGAIATQGWGGNNTAGPIDVATACRAHGSMHQDFESETFITTTLDASYGRLQGCSGQDLNHTHSTLVPVAIQERAICENPNAGPDGVGVRDDGIAFTLEARTVPQAVAFQTSQSGVRQAEAHATLDNPLSSRPYADKVDQDTLVCFRAAGQDGFTPGPVAPPLASTDGGGAGVPTIAFSCKDSGLDCGELSPTLRSMGHDGSHANAGGQVAVVFDTTQVTSAGNYSNPRPGDPCHPLASGAKAPAVAFNLRGRDGGSQAEMAEMASVRAASGGSSRTYVAPLMAVRRLTPTECERLQGLPDGHTQVPYHGKPMADGPRYKMIGNGFAIDVVRWIGTRISMVEELSSSDS